MKTKKLPGGWNEVKIGDICLVDSGQGAPQGENYFRGTEVFVRAGDLNNLKEGVFVGEHCRKVTNEAIKKYKLKKYKKGSIVFPKSGMSIMTGNIAILNEDSYVVNHLAILESSTKINIKFLFYILKKVGIKNLCLNTSYPSIRLSDIKHQKILLPSLEIQKQIVLILEKAERAKVWRKEADELTKNFLKSVFVDMFGDLTEYSKSEIKDLCELITQGPNPQLNNGEESDDYGFIKTKDVYDDIIYYDKINMLSKKEFEKYKKFELLDNDVLLAIVGFGSIGKINIFRKIENRRVIPTRALSVIRLDKNKVNPRFFKFFFQMAFGTKIVENWTGGSTGQLIVKVSSIKSYKLPLPPIFLQNKFAEIVKEFESIREQQKQSKEQIDHLFNALMQKAFKGDLIKC
jgi:type I restriction enzyme, S subunit